MNSRTKLLALLAVLTLLIGGVPAVWAQDDSPLATPESPLAGPVADSYTLQVLHSSDNESAFQDPNTFETKILNYGAIVEGLRLLEADGSIHVTAGDHTLPGPFYEASAEVAALGAPGLGDIAIFNALGETATGIGNHEFDGGINDFARMLSVAEYPFLAVNLDFSAVELEGDLAIEIGEDGLSVEELAGKVAKSAYVEIGGERIGLIGRAPADFFNVVEDPDVNLPGLDFVGGRSEEDNQPLESAVPQVLEQVELLEAQGINKIILLDHAQDFTGDPLSARNLRGIDIIVAAGSTGFMGNPEADGPFGLLREGDEANASYPTLRLDSEGNLLLVVNSDQLYTYVGHLLVTFDGQGRIVNVDPRSGPIATTEEAIAALEEVVGEELTAPEAVQSTFNTLTENRSDSGAVRGRWRDGQRAQRRSAPNVRSMETSLGRLAADSTLWYAQNEFPELDVDIALKNGGGIRATIDGPNITRFGVASALAFDNTLSIVELTADQLLATMENAVSRVPAADGRFPQVAGMTLEYDASQPGVEGETSLEEASRIQSLVVTRADGTEDVLVEEGEVQGDLDRTFTVATNSFLLTGGDGYNSFAAAAEANGAEATELGERQILIDYVQEELGGEVRHRQPAGRAARGALGRGGGRGRGVADAGPFDGLRRRCLLRQAQQSASPTSVVLALMCSWRACPPTTHEAANSVTRERLNSLELSLSFTPKLK